MKNYRIAPIKKLLSNETLKIDGPDEDIFNLSKELGLISENEYKILLGIKNKTAKTIINEDIKTVLKRLAERKLIEKIDK